MSLKYVHRPGGSAYCPECKEAISQQANICPHCRSDLKSNEEWQTKKTSSNVGCSALIMFGFVATSLTAYAVINL